VTKTTDYIGGMQYEGNTLLMKQTAFGRLRIAGSAVVYEYYIKDHLGNNRVTFGDPNADGVADLLQEDHYYPFGLKMSDGTQTTSPPNTYRYNGKEYQDELGLSWYDYGARMYDPSIGRWNGVDALAEKYVGWSGYNFVAGNPLIFVDPDGNSFGHYVDQNANIIGTDGDQSTSNDYYVVTSSREVKDIRKADVTPLSKVSSAVKLPSLSVRNTMGEALARSNAPTGDPNNPQPTDDPTGGFHEEAGVYGTNSNGEQVAGLAPSGDYADPSKVDRAEINPMGGLVNVDLTLEQIEGTFHLHPGGIKPLINLSDNSNPINTKDKVFGGLNERDIAGSARREQNYGIKGPDYLLIPRENKVVSYNKSGTLFSLPLDKFLSLGKQ
jgi:RHS repeat-associated protein